MAVLLGAVMRFQSRPPEAAVQEAAQPRPTGHRSLERLVVTFAPTLAQLHNGLLGRRVRRHVCHCHCTAPARGCTGTVSDPGGALVLRCLTLLALALALLAPWPCMCMSYVFASLPVGWGALCSSSRQGR